MTDVELLEQWRGTRDAQAFRQIVARYGGLVYGTCRRVLADATEAEDVTQDCFVYLASRPPRIHTSLAAWLHRLATHRSYDRLKSAQRRRTREERYTDASATTTETSINDVLDHLDEAVDQLPEKYRHALVSHFYLEKSHAEIAKEIGLTRRAIGYRIDKGLTRLREHLKRAGVTAPAATLTTYLATTLCEAAPATVAAKIGKMALAGAATTPIGLVPTKLAIIVSSKMAGPLVATILIAAAAWWAGTAQLRDNEEPVMEQTAASTEPENSIFTEPDGATVSINSLEAQPDTQPATPEPEEIVVAEEQISSGLGSISGRVYDSETGVGLADAQIRVYLRGVRGEAARVESDEEGLYSVTGLDEGRYLLRMTTLPDDDRAFELTDEANVILSADSAVKEIDFAYRRGLVVSGIVLDPRGRPLPNVSVHGWTQDEYYQDDTPTDSMGRFLLQGFKESPKFFVYIKHAGYAMEPQGPLLIERGNTDDIILNVVPEATIMGTVVDPTGAPIQGMVISAQHRGGSSNRSPGFRNSPSDRNGQFQVAGLWQGSYRFSYWENDTGRTLPNSPVVEIGEGEVMTDVTLVYQPKGVLQIAGRVLAKNGQPIKYVRVGLSGRQDHFSENLETDKSGQFISSYLPEDNYSITLFHSYFNEESHKDILAGKMDLAFTLERRGKVEGQVIDAVTKRAIREFEIFHKLGSYFVPEWKRVTHDEGLFEAAMIQHGTHQVRVRAKGYAEGTSAKLEILPGETTKDVVLALQPVKALTGFVLDDQDQPIRDAKIFINEPPETGIVLNEMFVARSDDSGAFVIDTPNEEVTSLHVHHFKYAPAELDLEEDADSPLLLIMEPSGKLEGNVRFQNDPLSGLNVTIGDAHLATYEGRTSADGFYEIYGLGNEDVQVRVNTWLEWDTGRIGVKRLEPVSVKAGEATRFDFDFEVWRTDISGKVTINGEAPDVHSASVSLIYENSAQRYDRMYSKMEPDGSFTLSGARPGPARFEVNIPDVTDRNLEGLGKTKSQPTYPGGYVEILADQPNWIEFDVPRN